MFSTVIFYLANVVIKFFVFWLLWNLGKPWSIKYKNEEDKNSFLYLKFFHRLFQLLFIVYVMVIFGK